MTAPFSAVGESQNVSELGNRLFISSTGSQIQKLNVVLLERSLCVIVREEVG